jgi:hypothetical protein
MPRRAQPSVDFDTQGCRRNGLIASLSWWVKTATTDRGPRCVSLFAAAKRGIIRWR